MYLLKLFENNFKNFKSAYFLNFFMVRLPVEIKFTENPIIALFTITNNLTNSNLKLKICIFPKLLHGRTSSLGKSKYDLIIECSYQNFQTLV